MNWFDTSGLTSLAKTALKEAQKTIDKALDIQEEVPNDATGETSKEKAASSANTPQEDNDFFSSWGLTRSAEIAPSEPKEQPVVTESPSKSIQHSLWGSFTGTFFEPVKSERGAAIVSPPRANSMNVISDAKYGSNDDLLSKSQSLVSDTVDNIDAKKDKIYKHDDVSDRRDSSKSNRLSLVSSRNSSDSVEVLSHSLKTTPDSEAVSVHLTPHSSSLKLNSESVEVLPDSLVSPSSIECLGFDSCSSSTPSVNLSPSDSEKHSTHIDDKTEKPSGDSVSLVAEDDEDTMSYNSISECTAPTVLDTDEKSPKKCKSEKKFEPVHLELIPSKSDMPDVSWSDHTVSADVAEAEREGDEIVVDKLSDSSSFYNVSIKDKERTSPISSDKSDLVKICSEQTSGHTSGDDLETATSSDIEIIPSPNGERKHKTESHLVDIVLGKSLASKIRGHNRELSETSIQSNISDESQSENERLIRRLNEMSELLEARETRLMEISRSNVQLVENNELLKSQLHILHVKHEGSDGITEDYTQRMSALEKKFQQAIRDKDELRKQLDSHKKETAQKSSTELENSLRERDDIIAQLHEEGEKLSRQQLQHSNIIKKLRAKDKDNEQVIKNLRDKVTDLTSELDRLKRAMNAKEELEVNQIEAVYKLTTSNKKMEAELVQCRSELEDTIQKLASSRTSLEALKHELIEMRTHNVYTSKQQDMLSEITRERDDALRDTLLLQEQLNMLREERKNEESRWISRVETLRNEVKWAREMSGGASSSGSGNTSGSGVSSLLQQLATLQESALQREQTHTNHTRALQQQTEELELKLTKALESDRLTRDENVLLQQRVSSCDNEAASLRARLQELDTITRQRCATAETKLHELEKLSSEQQTKIVELTKQLSETKVLLENERTAFDTEKKRNAILQEQLSSRGDISPSQSLASESMSVSLWTQEINEVSESCSVLSNVDELASTVSRREAELRTLADVCSKLRKDRTMLQNHVANLQDKLDQYQNLQEQYDALLQMYGEKEEQLSEVRLDLHDVTQLYKQQLDEFVRLKKLQKP